jgi:hypothetical protein
MRSKETTMRLNRFVTGMVVSCAAVMISAIPSFAGQMQMPQQPQDAATAKAKPQPGMAAKCQAIMAHREKMMTEMKAADQRIDDLVTKMNTGSGMAKVAATAAVVSEMVTGALGLYKEEFGAPCRT